MCAENSSKWENIDEVNYSSLLTLSSSLQSLRHLLPCNFYVHYIIPYLSFSWRFLIYFQVFPLAKVRALVFFRAYGYHSSITHLILYLAASFHFFTFILPPQGIVCMCQISACDASASLSFSLLDNSNMMFGRTSL